MKKRLLEWLLEGIILEFNINNNTVSEGSKIEDCSLNLTTYSNILLSDVELPEGLEIVIRKITKPDK